MSYATPVETHKAAKRHRCEWCWQFIEPGETYKRYRFYSDDVGTVRMHPECHDYMQEVATVEDLWDWIETGFTYSQMMQLLADDGSEFTPEALAAIAEQIASYEGVIDRYRRTGRVGFSGPELLAARAAACVMDGLIDMDRHGIAERAAYWSINVMRRIRADVYADLRAQPT